MNLEFDVLGVPAPKGSTRAFMPKGARFPVVTAANPNTKPWQESVKWAARAAMLEGNHDCIERDTPVAVSITFRMPRPASSPKKRTEPVKKPDLDKLQRAVFDALTDAAVFVDDAQVVDCHARMRYALDGEPPGAHVAVLRWAQVL